MYVEIIILAILDTRPQHGYEIKKNVEQVHAPEFTLNNGQLYPALRRFEEMGAIEREVERQQGKPDRHIYRLTDLGREILHDMVCEFPPELARNEIEFVVRVAFFDHLEPEERLHILARREAVLRQSLDHHARIRAMEEAEHGLLSPFASSTMTFRQQRTQHELEWIEEMRRNMSPANDPAQGGSR